MEFRDLRYLEVLAAELHFGRAAARLHMSQPALSQALVRLEKEIGCPLFQRDHHGASLTNAGRVLLSETQGVSKSVNMACELSRRAGRGEMGSVSMGFIDGAIFDIVPPVLRKFRQRYPEVSVTSRQQSSAELARSVEMGQLDLAFTRREEAQTGVEFKTIRSEPLSLVVSKRHRLASAQSVSVRDLVNEELLFPALEGVPILNGLWHDICYAASFTPRISAYVGSLQVLTELVAQDIGIGFAAESWVQGHADVVVKELRDVDEKLEIAVAYRPEQLSAPARNLLELALDHCRELGLDRPLKHSA